jgi:hypothetical protein
MHRLRLNFPGLGMTLTIVSAVLMLVVGTVHAAPIVTIEFDQGGSGTARSLPYAEDGITFTSTQGIGDFITNSDRLFMGAGTTGDNPSEVTVTGSGAFSPFNILTLEIFFSGSAAGESWSLASSMGSVDITSSFGTIDLSSNPAFQNILEFRIIGSAAGSDSPRGFDNIQLQAIPEPHTALLLATGLAGLAAAGRRRSLH